MRYSKTALMELSHKYRSILRKCAFLNAAILMGAMIASPAMAETTNTINDLWILDSYTLTANETSTGPLQSLRKETIVLDGANYSLNGGGYNGAFIDDGQTITIKDFTAIQNFVSTTGPGFIQSVTANVAINNVTFTQNNTPGGVVFGSEGSTISVSNSKFENNITKGSGSAITNSSSALSLDNVVFEKNTAELDAGAIKNSNGVLTIVNGAKFINNSATRNGGAILAGTTSVTGDIEFSENQALNGGAINLVEGSFTVKKDANGTDNKVSFKDNVASGNAGAIALEKNGVVDITATTIEFIGNEGATNGGAIYNQGGTLKLLGKNNKFVENYNSKTEEWKRGGGAIHSQINATDATIIIGADENSVNEFTANTVVANGGAILSRGDGNGHTANMTFNGSTTFDANEAGANGAALYQYAKDTDTLNVVFANDVTFKNNIAQSLGGAIYNYKENSAVADIVFNGTTVFSGNEDSTGANDIYNDGTITFNGDVTLDGGISGNGSVTFAQGTSLTAELQKTTILANTVTFQGDNTLNLIVANGLANADYDFITAQTLEGEDDVDVTIADNAVYNLKLTEDGKINVSVKSGSEIIEGIDAPVTEAEGETLSAVIASNGNGTPVGNEIADAISEALQTGNAIEAVKAAKELAPTTSQQVMGVTQSVNSLLSNVTGNRMAAVGRSGGDTFVGGSAWAQGLYNHTKQDASGSAAGFSADTKGVALGIDGKLNESLTVGLGYGYNQTDADSDGRDIDVDGHNFFAYAQYQPNAWYINGMFSYGLNKYTEKKAPMGVAMEAKYDVNTYAANVMTGYDFENGITPEAGLRYVLADQESYNDGVQRISTDNNDVLTAVVGVKYSKDFTAKDWTFEPSVRLAATYDILSDNSEANVNVIGGGNYQITGQRLHRFGVEAGAGITGTIKNWDLSLEYNAGLREDFQTHTGMLKAKYNF